MRSEAKCTGLRRPSFMNQGPSQAKATNGAAQAHKESAASRRAPASNAARSPRAQSCASQGARLFTAEAEKKAIACANRIEMR